MSVSSPLSTAEITVQQYLTFERNAPVRHEFINGRIREMAGGTRAHTLIIADLTVALGLAVQATLYDIFTSEAKVRVADNGPFFYPDAGLTYGDAVFDADDCLRNPHTVIEVLSETSAEYDRGEKFAHYRHLVSLRHYVLIDQHAVHVEHFEKLIGDVWTLVGDHTSRNDSLSFSDVDVAIPLNAIYRRIQL